VQSIDVLRDQRVQRAAPPEVDERAVARMEAIVEKRGLAIMTSAGDRVGRDRGVLLRSLPLT
jgi:hypothetical protein